MTFELCIWSPAFGLPSIDPECIAAATYLHKLLPPEQWVLIAAHDAGLSPTGIIVPSQSMNAQIETKYRRTSSPSRWTEQYCGFYSHCGILELKA